MQLTTSNIATLCVCILCIAIWLPSDDFFLRDTPGLHNVIRVTPKLLSGSSPEGETGFRTLQKLGVKTIISVDGARPELPLSKKFGLRYVHLPIGYDGVPEDQSLRLAKAVKELPGLVYMHCHHGKHRSPAAAAVVKLHLDPSCSTASALAILKAAGTDPKYLGLFAATRDYQRPAIIPWDKVSNDFPEVAHLGTLVQRMVAIDEHWDRLKLCQQSKWHPPEKHPDIEPAHEALMLREHYVELQRATGNQKWPVPFQMMLQEAVLEAKRLETALREPPGNESTTSINKHFKSSQAICLRCHSQYRDVPQEKR